MRSRDELIRELSRSRYLGYYSMIHADRITDFTCELDGDAAKGSVSFKVPGLWAGKVQYAAERVDGRWRITEFQMPIHRWRFVRSEAGRWKWFTVFGDVEELDRRFGRPSGEAVSGKITPARRFRPGGPACSCPEQTPASARHTHTKASRVPIVRSPNGRAHDTPSCYDT